MAIVRERTREELLDALVRMTIARDQCARTIERYRRERDQAVEELERLRVLLRLT